MFGSISAEKAAKVPASEAWKLYGSLRLAKLIEEEGFATEIDVLEGASGAGSLLYVHFAPGTSGGMRSFKEKFTVVDDERRVKVSEVVEGGVLDLGFSLYRVRLEMIEEEEDKESCIVRATVDYELKAEAAANAAELVSIQPLVHIMQRANDILENNYNN